MNRTKCRDCGGEISVADAFPGAKIQCKCGAEIVVTAAAGTEGGPYRTALILPPVAPMTSASESSERPTPHRRERRCPRCKAPFGDDSIAPCSGCRGVFVRHDALDEALARTGSRIEIPPEKEVRDDGAIRYLSCPDCTAQMGRSLFGKRSGVVVDICPKHGIWFDSAELESAARYAVNHGRPPLPVHTAPRVASPEDALAANLKVALLAAGHKGDPDVRAGGFIAGRASLLDLLIDWIASD